MKTFNRIADFISHIRMEKLEAANAKQMADIEYIAMMTDVELESEEDISNEQ